MIQESDELKIDAVHVYIDEYEVIEFYDWQSERERERRIVLRRTINRLIDKIYHVIIQRHLTLYCLLQKHCRRAMQFLRSNRKILKSSRLRRK